MIQRCTYTLTVLWLLAAGAAGAQTTTIQVSPVPANPPASGTALLNALAAITDNSSSKPYVLKLDPGMYYLASTQLLMKPYVDIEGSGQTATVISGSGNGDTSYTTAIVKAAAPAELRDLQVLSYGGGLASSIGVYIAAGTAVSLRDVTITTGGATENWGIRNVGASPSIQNVTINLSSGGSLAYGIGTTGSGASPLIKDTVINLSGAASQAAGIFSDGIAAPQELRDLEISVTATGSGAYGIYVSSFGTGQTFLLTGSVITVSGATGNYGVVFHGNAGATFNVKTSYLKASGGTTSTGFDAPTSGTVTFDLSEVTGTTYSIQATGTTVNVGASRIAGTVSAGTVVCAGAYSATYGALSSICH
jgi:hypothetical protein